MDGSHHPWLGDERPQFTLLIAVDDATGCVVNASFSEKEDARSYFLLVQGMMQRCGIPVALYTDPHGVFRHIAASGQVGTSTQFSRAMDELGIQMIFALSPQAKGRVERAAGTFQDRLVTELRLSGASSIGEANSVLEQFLPRLTGASGFRRNTLSLHSGLWIRRCAWNRSCASSTAEKWPRTIQSGSSCIPCSCCLDRIVPATPERWWRSW